MKTICKVPEPKPLFLMGSKILIFTFPSRLIKVDSLAARNWDFNKLWFSGLSNVVAASLFEDEFGVIQRDLANLLTALLNLQKVKV